MFSSKREKIMTKEEVRLGIEKALDEIRPFLISDGGNISLIEVVEEKHVKVRLEGACVGCSVNQMTLKAGVETTIKKYVPQIETVENVA
jgi:Fe-S cluster biogenesis protein NfuA